MIGNFGSQFGNKLRIDFPERHHREQLSARFADLGLLLEQRLDLLGHFFRVLGILR